MDTEFLEKAKRELSARDIQELKMYQTTSPTGARLIFMPIVRKWGADVNYSVRVHYPGVSGPLPLSKAALDAGQFPESYLEKSRTFVKALGEHYTTALAKPEAIAQPEE